jgi:hypothetical protein
MGVVRETVQDYGESSTTHGITYILQRNTNTYKGKNRIE